jgi:hypothetical protein
MSKAWYNRTWHVQGPLLRIKLFQTTHCIVVNQWTHAVAPSQEAGSINTSLTFEQLEAMSYKHINSSQVLLQIAINAGYSSIDEMLPGLEMLWDDVSTLGAVMQ